MAKLFKSELEESYERLDLRVPFSVRKTVDPGPNETVDSSKAKAASAQIESGCPVWQWPCRASFTQDGQAGGKSHRAGPLKCV